MLVLGATKREWIVLRDRETNKELARLTLGKNDSGHAPPSVEIKREPIE